MSDQALSERRSEKRGRPPVFTPEWRAMMRHQYPEVRTERGLTNRLYAIQALSLLIAAHQAGVSWEWICNPPEVDAGRQALPFSLLNELGRFDARLIVQVAEELSAVRPRPSPTEAARLLRDARQRMTTT
jgi:hypothetical protein